MPLPIRAACHCVCEQCWRDSLGLSTSVGVSRPVAHVLTAAAVTREACWAAELSTFTELGFHSFSSGHNTCVRRIATSTFDIRPAGRRRSANRVRTASRPEAGLRTAPRPLVPCVTRSRAVRGSGCQNAVAEACSPRTTPSCSVLFADTTGRRSVYARKSTISRFPVLISHETKMSHVTGRLAPSQRCSSWDSGSTGRTCH